MNNKSYLVIEFKLGDIVPWTVIYKTTNVNDLIFVYNTLSKNNIVQHRCSILSEGRYIPIIF